VIWLRLDRGQLALVLLSTALFVAAIVVLLLPAPALPGPATHASRAGSPPGFDVALPSIANDPAGPLVDANPFDASRQPPATRRTTLGTEGGDEQAMPAAFTLLGTVITGNGRDMAVIRANPAFPTGATYRVGDEPLPGYRLTSIRRDGVTISGNGQLFELEIQKAGEARAPQGLRGAGYQGDFGDVDEDQGEEANQ
jgi:hypothetical protein